MTEESGTVRLEEQYEKVLAERNSLKDSLEVANSRVKELELNLKGLLCYAEYGGSQWISVEDRLPPHDQVLLVWRPVDHKERPFHKEIIVGKMAHGSTSSVWANGMDYDIETHITHWMPLPSPPLSDKD